MKYIRGQDGCIYSVSKLTPPCEEHPEGEAVWKLRVVTATGSIHVYATYRTEAAAVLTYKQVTEFMAGDGRMVFFTLGVNGICHHVKREVERPPTPRVEVRTAVPVSTRPWLEIPASVLTPWWRYLWPLSRKEKANDEPTDSS